MYRAAFAHQWPSCYGQLMQMVLFVSCDGRSRVLVFNAQMNIDMILSHYNLQWSDYCPNFIILQIGLYHLCSLTCFLFSCFPLFHGLMPAEDAFSLALERIQRSRMGWHAVLVFCQLQTSAALELDL